MKKIILKQTEKRFLIIWLSICLFAFIVNTVPIKGSVGDSYLWTLAHNQYKDDFYPFTTYFDYIEGKIFIGLPDLNYDSYTRFNGMFNSFDLPEFLVYSLLGLAIIFLPKIW